MTLDPRRISLVFATLAGLGSGLGGAHAPPAALSVRAIAPPALAARAPASGRAVPLAPKPPTAEGPSVREAAIYFDFDSSLLRDDARTSLQTFATTLSKV